jgi:hypothetical protein
LLWPTEWGIWGDEAEPIYYRIRQSYADHRLLHEAPGHLFLTHEREDLATFIQLTILNGWGGFILSHTNYLNAFISHDEYVEFFADEQLHIDIVKNELQKWGAPMSTVQEIEQAIRQLSPEQLAELSAWLAEFDHAAWDDQIAADAAAGRLDALADEALRELREGRCTDLWDIALRLDFGRAIGDCQSKSKSWHGIASRYFAKTLDIRRCASSASVDFGPYASVVTIAHLLSRTAQTLSGSGSARTPSTTRSSGELDSTQTITVAGRSQSARY